MDNTDLAIKLYRYVEANYPLNYLRSIPFKRQSARRWAVCELAKTLLDHPHDDPMLQAELFVGRLACMVYRIQHSDHPERDIPFVDAIGAILTVEEAVINR